jgi:hypothetical protein
MSRNKKKRQGAIFHNIYEIGDFDAFEYDYFKEEKEPVECPDCLGRGNVALFYSVSECLVCSGSGYLFT